MNIKNMLQADLKLPQEKATQLPNSFQRVGDFILIPIPEGIRPHEKDIGRSLLRRFRVKAVYARGPIRGELRTPRVRLLAGRGKRTVQKEHGYLFSLDVTKIMFSKGNLTERVRLTPLPGETIIDMFAGIGYFTIPLAKKEPTARIIAIEKNKDSFSFLKNNIRLNRLSNVEARLGDCRSFKLVGDRVLMGYFPGTELFLPTALSFIPHGGMIHYHNIYAEKDLFTRPEKEIADAAVRAGFSFTIEHWQKVKQYAPRVWHVTLDVRLKKFTTKESV